MMLLAYRLLAIFGTLVLGTTTVAAQTLGTVPGHVGSQTCSGCHEGEAREWTGSHHAWSWTLPDETTVLGDFDDAGFEHKGAFTFFTRHDGSFLVETEGSGGAFHTFQLVGAGGGAPRGKAHGNYRHGGRTREAVEARMMVSALVRLSREMMGEV